MNRQASKLYDLYIRQGSVDQVPLTREMITSILYDMESHPSPLLFNRAQDVAEEILRNEIYTQFLSSEECSQLRKEVLAKQHHSSLDGTTPSSSMNSEELAREKQQKIAQLRQASLGKTSQAGATNSDGGQQKNKRSSSGEYPLENGAVCRRNS